MAEKKKNLYENLGVSPTASPAELKAAHRRLSFETMSGKLSLSNEDRDYRLQLLDVALNTLLDPFSRDVYDAQLAAANQGNVTLPAKLATGSLGGEGQALQVAAVVAGMYKTGVAASDEHRVQVNAVAQTVGASLRSVKIILQIVLWSLILGVTLRMGGCVLAARDTVPPPAAVARAEGKLIVQEYYKKHGVRAANRAEVAALEAENRRSENDRREEEFNQRKAEDASQRFIEESQEKFRRLEREQERAKAEARYAAIRRQRESQSQRESSGE